MNRKIESAVLGAFIADAYVLGAHWIYDEKQLAELPLDWEKLNAPAAMWHEGKAAGDFTHYGDHTLWLLEYLEDKEHFDVDDYALYWLEKMKDYQGYVDGSSRDTITHLKEGKPSACGPVNHDLSICGRIAPFLLVAKDKDDFISQAVMFAKVTHNESRVLEATHFFASLLCDVIQGKAIIPSMEALANHYSPTIQTWIKEGIASKENQTFDTIRNFGPACGVEGGFAGTVHLLSKYTDLKSALQENAKAGGDSAARGMIVGMILGVDSIDSVAAWQSQMNAQETIKGYLDHFKA